MNDMYSEVYYTIGNIKMFRSYLFMTNYCSDPKPQNNDLEEIDEDYLFRGNENRLQIIHGRTKCFLIDKFCVLVPYPCIVLLELIAIMLVFF